MQFNSFSDAMAMGGHGPYVWGAYAITLVVVMVILLRPIAATRRLQSEIRRASSGQSPQSMDSRTGNRAGEVVDAPQT